MSSTLQIGLAVAGGVVLAGIVAHSAWSSRKNAPRLPDPEPSDALTPALEPSLEDERQEPGFDEALRTLPPPASADRRTSLDPLIDVIAPIAVDAPVSGDAALAASPSTRRVGSKTFAIEGRNVATEQWERPVAGQRYDALQAGVQLANRTGALNEIEFSEFVMKAQAFADAVNGAPEFPDMREEVARARELDQFASAHDAQLSFTLRALNAAWSPGYLQQNATRLGFTPGLIPGRMVLPSATIGMPSMLVLSFDAQAALAEDPDHSALRGVTLTLDVPQVERAEQPFVRMREVAATLAQAMDGVVTDDAARPLSPDAMDVIGSELEQLYDTLDARDLSAGSALARRLFS
jgi:hypothetical protein